MHDPRLLKDGSKILKEGPVPDGACQNCGKPTTRLIVSGSYSELVGVPLFPTDKSVKISCTDCGHLLMEHAFSEANRKLIKDLRKGVKYPLHWYGALWGLLALIIYVVIMYFIKST